MVKDRWFLSPRFAQPCLADAASLGLAAPWTGYAAQKPSNCNLSGAPKNQDASATTGQETACHNEIEGMFGL
jgi:hypothetical protein